MAVLGLRSCARALPSRGKRGPLLIAVRGPLTIAAPPAAEHRLQTRRLSSCGSRAQSLRGTRDPPRPGLEPVSPALAGGLSTTAPPGKPRNCRFLIMFDLQEKGKFICFNLVYFLSARVRKPKWLWESHCRGGVLWSCSSVLLPGGGPSAALVTSQPKDSWSYG